jgi:hypothetical protein
MKLSPEDLAMFYRIWFALLTFVNTQTKIAPNWPKIPKMGSVSVEDAALLRDALWKDESLLGQFVAQNPSGLTEEELLIVGNFIYRVQGTFIAIRSLKKHTIVLYTSKDTSKERAYGVIGLSSSLDELFSFFPQYFEGVIMPFRDKIVPDGLFRGSLISFGGNMSRSFKEKADEMQDRYGLITNLPSDPHLESAGREKGTQKLLQAFRRHLLASNLSEKVVAQNVQTLQEMSEVMQPQALHDLDLEGAQRYLALHPKDGPAVKRFARFLFETDRGNEATVWDLQEIRRRDS